MSTNSNRKLDAESIANIAQDLLNTMGYKFHTVREVRTNGHVWKLLAEADKVELTIDGNGKLLGYVLHKTG